jgi:hypothetical protein
MIGKKRLTDVRTSLLDECAKSRIDPARWLDEQIGKLEVAAPVNAREIETLKLIRDGLQSKSSRPKRVRKRTRARSAD